MFKKIFIPISIVFIFSCGNNKIDIKDTNDFNAEMDSDMAESIELSEKAEEDIIFYNLLYPVDLGVVIDKKGSFFNSSLLNPLNNISNYQDSRQIALALGLYGADLSYLWVFKQSQQALSYFTAIKQLAYEIGIPEGSIKISAVRAESYADNIDSLVSIARESYRSTDEYLVSANKQELAVLILLGGWVETLNTSLHLYLQPNERMALKILSQKYSLTSLINLMSQNASGEILDTYSESLFNLLGEFDMLQNKYLNDQLELDTINRSIRFRSEGDLQIAPSEFDELKLIVKDLRNSMIY